MRMNSLVLLMAFEQYATDQYSDNDIARLLNGEGYRSKTGRQFSKETVRDILQNQTYLGKTKYQKYKQDRMVNDPMKRPSNGLMVSMKLLSRKNYLNVASKLGPSEEVTEWQHRSINHIYCERLFIATIAAAIPPKEKRFVCMA